MKQIITLSLAIFLFQTASMAQAMTKQSDSDRRSRGKLMLERDAKEVNQFESQIKAYSNAIKANNQTKIQEKKTLILAGMEREIEQTKTKLGQVATYRIQPSTSSNTAKGDQAGSSPLQSKKEKIKTPEKKAYREKTAQQLKYMENLHQAFKTYTQSPNPESPTEIVRAEKMLKEFQELMHQDIRTTKEMKASDRRETREEFVKRREKERKRPKQKSSDVN